MYRDRPRFDACSVHGNAPSVGRCPECDSHVCELCTTYAGLGAVCSGCLGARRRRRRWHRVVALAFILGGAGSLVLPHALAARQPVLAEAAAFVPLPSCDVAQLWRRTEWLHECGHDERATRVIDEYLTHCQIGRAPRPRPHETAAPLSAAVLSLWESAIELDGGLSLARSTLHARGPVRCFEP